MSRVFHIKASLGLVCALALAAAACGNDSSTTAPTTPTATAGTDSITGTLAPGGVLFHNFTASAAGTVNVTLTTTDPSGALVGLAIGVPGANTGSCDLTKTVQTRSGTAAQLSASVEAGDYCAGTYDIGGLPKAGVLVIYTVAHP